MAQSLTPAEQIDELRRVMAERDTIIAAYDAERAEAAILKARLTTALLEIEHIKRQLAMLRRQRFGQSSERLDHEIAQLEMRLEDFEETLASRSPPPRRRRAPTRGRNPNSVRSRPGANLSPTTCRAR